MSCAYPLVLDCLALHRHRFRHRYQLLHYRRTRQHHRVRQLFEPYELRSPSCVQHLTPVRVSRGPCLQSVHIWFLLWCFEGSVELETATAWTMEIKVGLACRDSAFVRPANHTQEHIGLALLDRTEPLPQAPLFVFFLDPHHVCGGNTE